MGAGTLVPKESGECPVPLPRIDSPHPSPPIPNGASAKIAPLTQPARDAFEQRFLDEAGGDAVRAENLRRAYFHRIALKSAVARRKKNAERRKLAAERHEQAAGEWLMPRQVTGPVPEENRPSSIVNQAPITTPDVSSLATAVPAYLVLLVGRTGNQLRRPYLSLHSAEQAPRAQKRGQTAHLVLCQLRPVAVADLADLAGGDLQ